MPKIVNFPNIEQIEEQTAAWLSAIDRGLTEAEKEKLQYWLAQSPMHAEKLMHFASAWDLMDLVAPIAKLLPLGESYQEIQSPVSFENANYKPRNIASGWIPIMSVMASTVFAVFLMASFPKPVDTSFSAFYSTEIGEQSDVTLPDGSHLELNTGTAVSVYISDTLRRVLLIKGEAYFDVAKNPEAPFVAQAGDTKVIAIGTAFNIEVLNSGDMEVVVTEGKVLVEKSNQEVTKVDFSSSELGAQYVSVGEKIRISEKQQNSLSSADNVNIETDLAWRSGMLIFQGESLEQVILEINRYTSLDIKIIDDSIRNIEVGGFFRAGDIEELIVVLSNNFGISSERRAGELLLSNGTLDTTSAQLF